MKMHSPTQSPKHLQSPKPLGPKSLDDMGLLSAIDNSIGWLQSAKRSIVWEGQSVKTSWDSVIEQLTKGRDVATTAIKRARDLKGIDRYAETRPK